jgi:Zn-dependent protease
VEDPEADPDPRAPRGTVSGAPGAGDERARRRIENLRAVLEGVQAEAKGKRGTGGGAALGSAVGAGATGAGGGSAAQSAPGTAGAGTSHRGRNGILGGIAAAAAVVASKLKFLGLLAGVLKLKTLASMIISVALYATQWGWAFAVGLVLLIFVHETGHWIVLRHEKIPAGAPVFIPFLGAFIAMRGLPRDAFVEAKVGIGGPILGSLGAWAVLAAGLASGNHLLVTLGHVGILINLFNLIPVSPLDGGRIAGAFTRGLWIAGYALGVAAFVATLSPLLLLVLAVGLFTMWQRLRHPIPGYDAIPRGQRLAIGAAYAVLVIALSLTLPIGLQLHPAVAG